MCWASEDHVGGVLGWIDAPVAVPVQVGQERAVALRPVIQLTMELIHPQLGGTLLGALPAGDFHQRRYRAADRRCSRA
jgi:hypothetical protein